jgi:hypothetical protein
MTIEVTTAAPYPLLLTDFASFGVVSASANGHDGPVEYLAEGCPGIDGYLDSNAYNDGTAAIGTGPYKFVEYVPGERIAMERFDGYWGDAPHWQSIVIRPITNDGARVAALLAGDVDVIEKPPVQDLERLRHVHQRGDVTHRADVHLGAGQERNGATQVNGEATLHAAKDHAINSLIVFERLLQAHPRFFAASLVARQHGFAHGVLNAVEENFHFVADAQFLFFTGGAELAQWHAAFGLQANIDDGQVVLDGNDLALYDTAFGIGFFVEARIEHGREIVAGRGESFGFSHSLTFFQSTYMPGPRKSSQDIPLCA